MKSLALHSISIAFIVVLVVLSLIDQTYAERPNWLLFFGRFHPVLLHLPIGLFAGAVVLEFIAIGKSGTRRTDAIAWLWAVSFVTASISALLGIFLSWDGGYAVDTLGWHKWGGVACSALFYALAALSFAQYRSNRSASATTWIGIAASSAVVFITGHNGGSLTHGSTYLTEHFPLKKKEAPLTAEEQAALPVYETHIQPILDDYCVQCHGPDKVKGDLRLDTFAGLMKGGEFGESIIPGDAEGSFMMELIHYPIDDEEHMPPEGKPQPSDEDIALLEWWIDQGASETATIDELEITPEVAPILSEVKILELNPIEEIDSVIAQFKSAPSP